MGAVVTEKAFDIMSENSSDHTYPSRKTPVWDSPSLTDFVIPRDAAALQDKLDAYMDVRYISLDSARSAFQTTPRF